MEDINFKKFICYILNCIGATDSKTIFYVDNKLKKSDYDAGNSRIAYDDLKHTYAAGAIPAAAAVADVDANSIYTILNDNASNIKQYFNIKQVPSYIIIEGNNKQLNVSQSIHQAFDLINVFFDAKSWYLKQYRDLQNPISRSGIIFNSDNKRKFYGGTKIEYKDDNKEVNGITYDQLLSNVLKDIIYMITDETEEIKHFDVITLYILSKINYYLAKRYAVLSLNNTKGELHKALEEYAKITEYDTKFFDNFTYYNKEEIDNKDFPRYYQREILKLLNAGSSTNKNDDMLSYLLATENNENIENIDDNKSFNYFTKYYNYLTQYKLYFENDIDYKNTYTDFKTKYDLIENIKNCIIEIRKSKNDKPPNTDADNENKKKAHYKTNFTAIVNKYSFPNDNIKNVIIIVAYVAAAAADVDAATVADKINTVIGAGGTAKTYYDDTETKIRDIIIKYIQNNINVDVANIETTINNYECITLAIRNNINTNMIAKINLIKKTYIPKLFKAIKTYIKKYSNNTFSSVYQSPTTSYTVTPMNIRPLIAKRATETDLSNYAAQIASDSFLNSNKLPALPEVTTLDNVSKLFKMVGGSTNINNSSNVYRTIFNSILNTLNSKKIQLNKSDREKVDKSLNELEQTEQYLKSTLSDYAKYASATEDRKKIISYDEIHKFVTDYENKLREYNKNSAHMLKFIGKLTRYLVIK